MEVIGDLDEGSFARGSGLKPDCRMEELDDSEPVP